MKTFAIIAVWTLVGMYAMELIAGYFTIASDKVTGVLLNHWMP